MTATDDDDADVDDDDNDKRLYQSAAATKPGTHRLAWIDWP